MKTGRAECTNKSHETLIILGWVLFIEKATRLRNEKDLSLSLLSEEVFITRMMSDE